MPYDWTSNYSEYYYKFNNGTGFEYRSYEGVQKESYVKLTSEPSDWYNNFSSYYRKVYEKTTGSGSKKKTVLVDTVDHKDAKYVNCQEDDDKKNGRHPSFSKRAHYRQETYTVPPSFNANNCYRIKKKEVAPEFDPIENRYYSMRMVYHAPKFIVGEAYQKVFDHYSGMAETAIEFFEEERIKNYQEMELDYFVVNIGDIIGGTDEFTKTNVIGTVSNIEAKIENGLIDVRYSVSVDDYTSALIVSEG